ncbi:hypothetical protein NCCP2222_11290 [Sporosarcina sp. NCCP-2222]|uniref:vWA domain-containing protein n=1 Tax=Sporosarcina sp. NCCP-2222 TaxID=2935073 RepID=UPI002084984D|nr:VWA domain-containing protein [Sporosarcina sp. NCCP-2222]GKV55182.1 hypothetical protein NCCP2222_11290 [Sporosarcina sp. NCCP-2222]
MKSKKWHVGWLIICCLGLIACSDQKETKKVEAAPESTVAEVAEEVIPTAARTVEEMIEQPAGKLIEENMDPKIEAARTVDYVKYFRYYEDEFSDMMKEQLSSYFKDHPEAEADEIYDYLVFQLGSGQYKGLYEQLASYEHGYVMPELPDGEDEIEIAKRQKTNVVILMDASGSMKGEVDGRVKMDLAKEAIENFTSQLDNEVNVALFAYGHKGAGTQADKGLSCGAIDEVYPLSSYDKNSFHDAMESFGASGWTPLAGAIEKAAVYLASYDREEYRNIVYIVSDGIETCGGDPVEAAKQLNVSDIEAKVNIIGFDVDDEGQAQLKQVAEAGGGQYATVRNQSEFEGVLIKKWKPSMMQVLSQQGVKLHEMVHQWEDLYAIYDPLSNLSTRERIRIVDAAYYLKNQKLIDEEEGSKVIELAKQMGELRDAHFVGLKDQKGEEAEKAMKEIDDAVQAWQEKWKKELENE